MKKLFFWMTALAVAAGLVFLAWGPRRAFANDARGNDQKQSNATEELEISADHEGRRGGPGDEVIVVYNSRMPESKRLAEYYAEKRGVPPSQLFGFDLPDREEITRGEFRDELQRPLAKKISERKLWRIASNLVAATNGQPERVEWKVAESKIRYAVLCYGLPLKVASESELKEPGTENLRVEMRRNEAAVDSELALLPMIEDRPPLSGPLRNPVYGTTNAAALHPTNGVLLVARLDGPSVEIARGLVDKAMEAERNGLWGRAYFDIRSITDPGFKIGDDWIANAASICEHLGFQTVVDTNGSTFSDGFPMSEVGMYMGWYSEHVCGPFRQPKFEFMPGAFAYHLHSHSASTLRSTDRHWVGPLLALGATATMGSVYEPYLGGTPDMAVFAARFVFSQFSFGEAACASQSVLSWQTTVVGDPLYRPFGKNPEVLHDELVQSESKLLPWSYLRLVNLNLANRKPAGDCATLLEELQLTKRSAVLTEKLAELYAALGKPASSAHALSQALDLDPSPRARLRILLALGEKQVKLGQDAEAYETFRKVIGQFPDYAERAGVYRQLAGLAKKLDKKEEAERYELEVSRLTPPKPS